MKEKYGIILLDKTEVIITIYEKTDNTITKTYDKQYDLSSFSNKTDLLPAEVVEIVAQTAMDHAAASVMEWKICARNVAESTVGQISHITSIKSEILSLTREQALICNAIAAEFQ